MMLFSTVAFSQFSVGGGLTITTADGFDRAGVSVRGVYVFSENWRASSNINIPFPESSEFFGTTIKTSYFDFSADAHYVFPISDAFRVYGLAGINFFSATVKVGSEKDSASEAGLEIGGGAEYLINDKLSIFGEPKYVLGDADRFVLSLGVLSNLLKFRIS